MGRSLLDSNLAVGQRFVAMESSPLPGKLLDPFREGTACRELAGRKDLELQVRRPDHQSHATIGLVIMPEAEQAKMDPAGGIHVYFF